MYAEHYVRREFLKAGSALLISVLWRDEPESAGEERMAHTATSNSLPSVLTYEDLRSVAPARLSTTRRRRSSTVSGSVRSFHRATAASSRWLLLLRVCK